MQYFDKTIKKPEFDEQQFQRVVARIIEFLCAKAMYEKRPQSETNQTHLAGITFYITGLKQPDGTIINPHLAFNVPPTVWDFEKIMWEVDERERVILINQGINIHTD